jgi:hypothetical protein
MWLAPPVGLARLWFRRSQGIDSRILLFRCRFGPRADFGFRATTAVPSVACARGKARARGPLPALRNQRACGVSQHAALSFMVLAGVWSRNCYFRLGLKQGPAT